MSFSYEKSHDLDPDDCDEGDDQQSGLSACHITLQKALEKLSREDEIGNLIAKSENLRDEVDLVLAQSHMGRQFLLRRPGRPNQTLAWKWDNARKMWQLSWRIVTPEDGIAEMKTSERPKPVRHFRTSTTDLHRVGSDSDPPSSLSNDLVDRGVSPVLSFLSDHSAKKVHFTDTDDADISSTESSSYFSSEEDKKISRRRRLINFLFRRRHYRDHNLTDDEDDDEPLNRHRLKRKSYHPIRRNKSRNTNLGGAVASFRVKKKIKNCVCRKPTQVVQCMTPRLKISTEVMKKDLARPPPSSAEAHEVAAIKQTLQSVEAARPKALTAGAALVQHNIRGSIWRKSYQIYRLGEPGSGLRKRGAIQDFLKLRDQCLERGTLFEDPEFAASDNSVGIGNRGHFEWLRPMEIANDPQLFVEGASRFDVQQGELGDCWLLAAVANLTLNQNLFSQIVPSDQEFSSKYAGIFHFRFWQYGRWVDVVIDDRLPTIGGRLVFLHSATHNEFWSALLEKAYAKLHGSYEALKGGSTCEAMEDFTGGVSEIYELPQAPSNLFTIMLKAYERSSLMGCSIEPDPNVTEAITPQGLVKGHAYSLTKIKYMDIRTPNTSGRIPLIRLRNPWGNETEWNGAWSDKSPEWRYIPDHEKHAVGLTFDSDGEFWISYQDFVKHFTRLEICNLSPDSLTDDDHSEKRKWEMSMYEGEWVRGVTAGGCRNSLDTFWHNPQYIIELTDPDDEDEDDKCTVIIALMQKNRRMQRRMGIECLTIGFAVYHLQNPQTLPRPLDLKFFKYNASVARSPTFINLREVSCRFRLPPGTYCVVPSTFEPNEEGEFIIRVFSETPNNMKEHDDTVGFGKVDDRVVVDDDGEIRPDGVVDEDPDKEKEPVEVDQRQEKVKTFFKQIAGDDMEVDWVELKQVLDYAMKQDLPRSSEDGSMFSVIGSLLCGLLCKDTPLAGMFETRGQGFSKDVCRSMIAMMDIDRSGKLGFEEFKTLWIDIKKWKNVFKLYDTDNSGRLDGFELRQALNSAGYRLNNHILNILSHRYGNRDGQVTFDDFMMCAVRLKAMIEMFQERDPETTNEATFSLEEWVEKTMYS